MEIIKTNIEGPVIIEPKIFGDARGYFFESFSQREFDEKVRPIKFVQDNESKSCYGVVRGLHFQTGKYAQSKLLRVVTGRVLDVVVDIRKGSPTFGKSVVVELSEENKKQLFVPKGFLHGFVTLTDNVEFSYKVDDYYSPENDRSVCFCDEVFGIDWGIENPILSEKDIKAPKFCDSDVRFFYERAESLK